MTLQELYHILNASTKNGTLDITIDTAESAYMNLLLAAKADKLTITGCSTRMTPEYIETAGSLNLGRLTLERNADINLRSFITKDGYPGYELKMSVLGEGTLEQFFGKLPVSQVFDSTGTENINCIYQDIVLIYPVITSDSNKMIGDKPFQLEGFAEIPDNRWWSEYPFIPHHRLSVLGVFGLKEEQYDGAAAIVDFNLSLAETASLPFGEASVTLNLVSKEADGFWYNERYRSSVRLMFGLSVKNLSDGMKFYMELFRPEEDYLLSAYFTKGLSMGNIINFFSSFFHIGEEYLLLPEDTLLTSFGLKEIYLNLKPGTGGLLQGMELNRAYIICNLSKPWKTPVPNLVLDEFMTAWEISIFGAETPLVSLHAAAGASLRIGKLVFRLTLNALLPQLDFDGKLEIGQNTPSLSDLMETFAITSPEEFQAEEKELMYASVAAHSSSRSFYLDAAVTGLMEFHIGSLLVSLAQIEVEVAVTPADFSFGIEGIFALGEGDEGFEFSLSANYEKGWVFQGSLLRGEVNVGKLLGQMFQISDVAESVLSVALSEFQIRYDMRNKEFKLLAAFHTGWDFTVLGVKPELGGRIQLIQQENDRKADALFYIDLEIFRVLVQMANFYTEKPSYLFRLEFRKLYLQAAYEKNKESDEIITVELGGMTLGEMVEELVRLVNPNAHYKLSAPWNVIHKIDLSRFTLVYNATRGTAVFMCRVGLNIAGLMEINEIGARYEKGTETAGAGVKFVVTGRLLDKEYTRQEPLTWDAVTEKPPENHAFNEKKISVYYIGMGQHLQTQGVSMSESIPEAIKALKDQIKAPNGGELPDLSYDANSEWLFGLDFKINDMFRFQLVLNDPVLYGAAIEVSASDKSPLAAFNGLKFELLYKKISDGVGMFRVSFVMSERFRKLNLGAIVLQIGLIMIEVYTNGSFLIDLGFPHNNDFSNSFGITFSIYSGRGGFYFGVLTMDAVKNVPKITNGSFSPVILLGIGLEIGLMRSFDLGIIQGGLSVMLSGIFEGVLAFFKPLEEKRAITGVTGRSQPEEAVYYYVRARAGIRGTLFLSVDLKIIGISVSAAISAWCQLTIEAYKKMLVELDVSLKIQAKIKILFFKISFSFHFHQNVTFALGSDSATPWRLAEGLSRSDRMSLAEYGQISPKDLFHPVEVGSFQIAFAVSPLISSANPAFYKNKSPVYCAAFLGILRHEDFGTLLSMLLRWILSACTENGQVPARQIAAMDSSWASYADYGKISEFLDLNLQATISIELEKEETGEAAEEGVIFPMPEQVILHMGDQSTDFGVQPIPEIYTEQLSQYFARLNADPSHKVLDEEGFARKRMEGQLLNFSAFIWTDWFQMVLSELINQLQKFYTSFQIVSDNLPELCVKYGTDIRKLIEDNRQLKVSVHKLPELSYVLQKEDTFKGLRDLFQLDEEDFWNSVKDKPRVLSEQAEFTIDSVFDNSRAGLSAAQAGAMYYVRFHEYEISGTYSKYAAWIMNENEAADSDWECMEPYSHQFRLPVAGQESYLTLAGDHVNRLAKYCALLNGDVTDAGWLDFLNRFLTDNGLNRTSVANSYTVHGNSRIDGDITPERLYARIYPDKLPGFFPEDRLAAQHILNPLTRLELHHVKLDVTETVERLLADGICQMGELAEAIGSGGAVMEQAQELLVTGADYMEQEELITKLVTEKMVTETAAMVSRFFLQGLRVPPPSGNQTLRGLQGLETAPLYQLTGQQFILENPEEDMGLSLERNGLPGKWLTVDSKPQTFPAAYIQKQLPSGVLKTVGAPVKIDDFLVSSPCFSIMQTFELQNKKNKDSPLQTIALFTRELTNYTASCEEAPDLFGKDVKQEDYSWGNLTAIEISRTEHDNIYNVYGADSNDRLMIRWLLHQGAEDIQILYRPSGLDSDVECFVGEAYSENSVFVKTNLSTETHMDPVYLDAETPDYQYSAKIVKLDKFLRMVWECSTIGGIYYLRLEGGTLPKGIFDENGRSKLWLLTLFSEFRMLRGALNCVLLPKKAEDLVFYGKGQEERTPLLPPGCVGLEMQLPVEEGDHPQALMDQLFTIVGYQIAGEGIENSDDSAPVVPQGEEDSTIMKYRITVPLYRFAGDGISPYTAVGKTAVITPQIRDVLGNRVYMDGVEIKAVYNDLLIGLHELPATSLTYTIVPKDGKAVLCIRCSYLENTEVTKEAAATLQKSVYQTSCPDLGAKVVCSIHEKADMKLMGQDLENLKQYIKLLCNAVTKGDRAPEAFTTELILNGPAEADKPFELLVWLVLTREGFHTEVTGAKSARSAILPDMGTTDIKADPFVEGFEMAFPELRLAQSGKSLFAVPVKTAFIRSLHINPYAYEYPDEGDGKENKQALSPEFYSLRPMSTSLMSRAVALAVGDGKSVNQTYTDVDMDVWGRRFFEDVERILSGVYSCQAAILCPEILDQILDHKKSMADTLSNRILPLRDGGGAGVASVRKLAKDRFLGSLQRAYDTDVIAVYHCEYTTDHPYRMEADLYLDTEYTVSPSKISSTEDGYCLFLTGNSMARSQELHLGAEYGKLEYDIEEQEDGYESSKWLKLIHPVTDQDSFASINLDSDVDIPKPLRECPAAPLLLSHRCDVKDTQFLRWNYQAVCSCKNYEHYTVYLKISFSGSSTSFWSTHRDFFDVLAEYDYNRTALIKGLDGDGQVFRESFSRLEKIISEAAETFTDWGREDRDSRQEEQSVIIKITWRQTDMGLVFEVIPDETSQNILNGFGAALSDVVLVSGGASGKNMEFSLEIKNLPLYQCQRAEPTIWIVQNENLLYDRKNGCYQKVNPAFIYRTQARTFTELKVCVDYENIFEAEGVNDVEAAVNQLFKVMQLSGNKGKDFISADLAVWYSYSTHRKEQGLKVMLPVTFLPDAEYGESATDLAVKNIEAWIDKTEPSDNQSALEFDVSVYSAGGEWKLANAKVRVPLVLADNHAGNEDIDKRGFT